MEHSQEEIITALKIIQDTCKAQGLDPCHNCPLSKNDTCILQDQAPEEWKINPSPPVWKAFE
jgi:hypothetical protein